MIRSLIDKLCYYHTWNIGFVEKPIGEIIISKEEYVQVNWLKHSYKNRFFADPFILSVDDCIIKVLVEDFPYFNKRGMISLLTVDRKSYRLLEKKTILKQPFHMSYPFIMRKTDGNFWIAPEASMSGNLYRYSMNPENSILEHQTLLVGEPLLDSTIVEYENKWWLLCTKRGTNSNKELFIYYAESPEGPYTPHSQNPVVSDMAMSRPGGYIVNDNGTLYRIIQKNDKSYGEAINVSKIDKLTTNEFAETFLRELRAQKDIYSGGFHTINGLDDICVVDGLRVDKSPIRKIANELINILRKR